MLMCHPLIAGWNELVIHTRKDATSKVMPCITLQPNVTLCVCVHACVCVCVCACVCVCMHTCMCERDFLFYLLG